jgi:hypothetical protein
VQTKWSTQLKYQKKPGIGTALSDCGGPAPENFNIDEINAQINGNGNPKTILAWEVPETYVIFTDYDGYERYERASTQPKDYGDVWFYLYPADGTQTKRVKELRNKHSQQEHSDALSRYVSDLYERLFRYFRCLLVFHIRRFLIP